MVITLPLPPRPLFPNVRSHWRVVAKARKAYRTAAWASSRMHKPSVPYQTAYVQATFWFPTRRRRDTDNLLYSLKSAFDGLQDAGVIENDCGFKHLPVLINCDPSRPRVEIVVRPSLDEGQGVFAL